MNSFEHFPFEFRMLQDNDGIIDLERGLVSKWQLLQSDVVVRRFMAYVKRLGRPARFYYPLFYNYNALLDNKFYDICEDYIMKLVDLKWNGSWPVHFHEYSTIKWFTYRILNRLKILQKIKNNDVMYLACPKEKFYNATKEFFNKLASIVVKKIDTEFIVFDQLVPAYNCQDYIKYFHKIKIIIVDRDPRDIYFDALNWSYIPTENIEDYIKWFKISRDYFNCTFENVDEILYIKFEDLVLKYDKMIPLIMSFLGIDDSRHIKKTQFFKPELSKQNVGKWRSNKFRVEMLKIEKSLGQYCYTLE